MGRPVLQFQISRARSYYTCSHCDGDIEPGQLYYYDQPHSWQRQQGRVKQKFCAGCYDSDEFWERVWGDEEKWKKVRKRRIAEAHHISVTPSFIEMLRLDESAIYRISAEDFELLICDRLTAMGFQAKLVGSTYRADGGIDIVFWSNGQIPILGAVQAKHHRDRRSSTGIATVRDFEGAIHRQFQVGVVVTNTTFTADAKWFAQNQSAILRLRDGDALRRWIEADFIGGLQVLDRPRILEPRKGLKIEVPWQW